MVEKVLSFGGSVLTQDLGKLKDFAEMIEQGEQKVIVTGAGELKKYIEAVDGNNSEKDMVGIQATRLNAEALKQNMKAYPEIPKDFNQVQEYIRHGEHVVMGGVVPGYSTDAVAATVAELLNAELYIVTNVKGVYTRDPSKPEAEFLEEVTVSDLRENLSNDSGAGKHSLIDRTALNLIERSNIPTKVLEGTVEKVGDLESAEGTRIKVP